MSIIDRSNLIGFAPSVRIPTGPFYPPEMVVTTPRGLYGWFPSCPALSGRRFPGSRKRGEPANSPKKPHLSGVAPRSRISFPPRHAYERGLPDRRDRSRD